MIKVFHNLKESLDIDITYTTNSIIFILRKLPILKDLITAPGFKEINTNQPLRQRLPNDVNDIFQYKINDIDILDKLKDIKNPYAFEAICNIRNFKNIDPDKIQNCFQEFIYLFENPSYKDKPCLDSPEKNSVAIEVFKQLYPHKASSQKDRAFFLQTIAKKIIQSNEALPLFTNSLVYFDCDKNNQGKRWKNSLEIDDYKFLKQIIESVGEDQKATFIKNYSQIQARKEIGIFKCQYLNY